MRRFSDEHKQKLREAHLRNPVKYWFGKKRSAEDKKKMSEAAKSSKRLALLAVARQKSIEARANRSKKIKIKKKQVAWNKGLKGFNSGEKSSNWQGGITTYERKLFLNRRRRAKLIGNGGSHTEQEWLQQKAKYMFLCLRCKKQEPEIILTRDHVIPLSVGGTDYIGNIQPLCQSCNSTKGQKIMSFC